MGRHRCKRIGVAEDGRPFCIHGRMIKIGTLHGTQSWACGQRRRERARERYAFDPVVREKQHDWNRRTNPKHNPRRVRIGDRHIAMAESPEIAQEINLHVAQRMADFRGKQHKEYYEARENDFATTMTPNTVLAAASLIVPTIPEVLSGRIDTPVA